MAEASVNDILGTAGDDAALAGTDGNDRIEGLAGHDVLIGYEGDDTLSGGEGNDTLLGSWGIDLLTGGAGDDVYRTGDAEDVIREDAAGGRDGVETSASFALPANVELLLLLGEGSFVGTGNELDNVLSGYRGTHTLFGLAGNDTLQGWEGDHTLVGGLGDDLYVVDKASTVILEEGNQGRDFVVSTAPHYALSAAVEALMLNGYDDIGATGNDEANVLNGNRGSNMLSGLGGADVVYGQDGHDQLFGGEGEDYLLGEDGDDTLSGGPDSDYLDGGAGIDQAELDGAADDFTLVRSADGSVIVAHTAGVERPDMLVNVEAVWFSGSQTWSWLADLVGYYGTGGSDAWLAGTDAGDRLYGLAGDDQLAGRGGHDTIDGGDGTDQAVWFGSSTAFSFGRNEDGSVTVTDRTGAEGSDTLIDVETLWFDGDQSWWEVETLAGNHGTAAADCWIAGTGRDDRLFGLGGDDQLAGHAGNDMIDGGVGAWDQAVYFGAITDFTVARNVNGSVTVTDLTGAEGTDTLVGVEALWFDASQTWGTIESFL